MFKASMRDSLLQKFYLQDMQSIGWFKFRLLQYLALKSKQNVKANLTCSRCQGILVIKSVHH